jgi:TonB family protein
MKRCPSCSRTYADETMSFCLADGALLSPPYSEGVDEGSVTALLPTMQPPSIPPTKAAPNLDIPTIAVRPPLQSIADESVRPTPNSRIWVLTAIVCALIVFAAAIFVYERNKSDEVAATDIQPAINDPSKLLSPIPIPSATPAITSTPSASPTRTPAVSPTEAKVLTTNPVLVQKNGPSPTRSSEIDDNRTFSGNEVDSRVQILSKPEPTYTDIARKNQVNGIVVLRAIFSSAGTVTNIHVVSGLADGLNERAISAAERIKFVPAMKDGHPVSMWMEMQYNFNLY